MNDPKKVKNKKKNFALEDNFDEPFQHKLRAACRFLTFISETDAAVIPFTTEKPASGSLRSYLAALKIESNEIEECDFDKFFERLTTEKDWHDEDDKRRTDQFTRLRDTLQKNLNDIRVIRVGRMHLDIYIAGVDVSGRLAGVKTKAIET
ncbi:MAG: nuclease A inhibitor family protein [Pyrinomonadaceae bacterium]